MSSPVATGLSTYTEDTTLDVFEMMSAIRPIEEPTLIPYTLEFIQEILHLCEPLLIQQEINHELVMPLVRKLGRLAKKLELTEGNSSATTIRHTYGLFRCAEYLINNGCTVLILESCTGTKEQVISDLDLRYTKGSRMYDCDYTQGRSNQSNTIYTWPERLQMKKYRTLKINASSESIKQVISFNFDSSYFNLQNVSLLQYNLGPREKDFVLVDKLTDGVQNLTWDQARGILNSYSEQYRDFSQDRKSMIKTPGRYSSTESYLKCLSAVQKNNKDKAKDYEEFRYTLEHSLKSSANQNNLAHDYFSLGNYDRIAQPNVPTRWIQPLPEYPRGYTIRDPFTRLATIVKDMDQDGLTVDAITRMIAKLDTMDQVSFSDVSGHFSHKYDDVAQRISLTRVYVKGVKVQAYKMKLINKVRRDSNINTDVIEALRDLNPSAKFIGSSSSLSRLEALNENYQNVMGSTGTGSYMIDDIDNMIDDVMEDGPLADTTRLIMRRCLKSVKNTKLLSQLALTEELTQAILTGPRKRKLVKTNVGGVNDTYIVMGLTSVSDRAAVVSHNLGPLTFGEFKDVTYFISGRHSNIPCDKFVKQHTGAMTSPLSMSPSQLDWNITVLHKAISWMSLRYETCVTHMPDMIPQLQREMIMPLSLCFLNSNTFSQVADQLRYFFVNGVGYTGGVGPLFEKVSWYSPKTTIEQLYVLRMFKMSDCLAVAKSMNKTDALVVRSQVKIHESHDLKMTFNVDGYLIAMPDESISFLSQQHTFNSFYNSRALTIQRYQKLVSEALVVMKQIEARKKYLEIKSWNLEHEGRFIDQQSNLSPDEVVSFLQDHNYVLSSAQPFSPCPRVTAIGFLATTLKIKRESEKTVMQTLRRAYKVRDVHRKMTVSSVMNNRGSVRSSAGSGLVVTRVDTDGRKKKKVTQNSKCYRTVLTLLNNFMKGINPPSTVDVRTIVPDQEPDSDNLDNLLQLIELPDTLGTVIAWLANHWAACISKMVHKDQLGAREIAVLNALARIMCRYVEDIARHIRDVNLSCADYTNLIEIPDKRDIVLHEKRVNDALSRSYNVCYDSADCSTWGPSMMVHAFYMSLRLRNTSSSSMMLRNCLALFGNKVFKIPDELYLATKANPPSDEDTSMVANVKREMLNLSPDIGDFNKQILYLEESMHQGILGCSSSVLGADAHNLSDFVLRYLFSDIGFWVKTFTTSDDYARVIRWKKGTQGTFKTLKDTLDIHVHILRTSGIKRNLQKSTLSKVYFEFNSEFFTTMGEIRPDIKSRLAFVDFSHETDPYPIALRAMNQSVEYLRSEGSMLGSCWTFLLNNVLAMYQNQSRILWKDLGRDIYRVPLELGGLIRPDPIKSVISHHLMPLCNNYSNEEDLELAFSLMADLSPFTTELREIEDTGEITLKLPSLSRSGTIHLCKTQARSVRALEEFLMTADIDIFSGLHQSRYASSLTRALMSCAQRERSTPSSEGSALRYMVTQTPSDARLYRLNSRLLESIHGDTRLTRNDLHNQAKRYLLSTKTDYPRQEIPLDFTQMTTDMNVYYDTMHHMIPASMSPVPRIGHTHVRRQTFSNQTYTYDAMKDFEDRNLPKLFGGTTDLHPWRYLEGEQAYANFLNKMTVRKQGFRLVLRERDQSTRNFVEIRVVSNYMAGTRLHYNFDPTYAPKRPIDSTLVSLLQFLDQRHSPSRTGVRASIFSPGLRQVMEQGRVAELDITELANVLAGDSSYFIRSQSLQQTVLSMLSNCSYADRLVVDPMLLSTGMPESKFKSSEGVITWQRNVITSDGFAGREVIMKQHGQYNHYLWGTRYDVLCPDDSDTDTYWAENLSGKSVMRVKLRAKAGFLMLSEYTSSDPIQVMSQTVVESTTIRLYMKNRLVRDPWFMSRMTVASRTQFLTANTIDYYHASQGLVLDVQEEQAVIDDGDAGFEAMQDDEDSDSEYEAGITDFLNMANNYESSSEEESDGANEAMIPNLSSSSSSSSGEESAPVSSQSSIRQPEGVLVSLSSSSICEVSQRQWEIAERQLGYRVSEAIMVTLPIKLNISRLADNDDESALEQLYSIMYNLDDIDRLWLEETLDSCFLQYGPVSRALQNMAEDEFDSPNDDDESW
jgi:hypothetical protein